MIHLKLSDSDAIRLIRVLAEAMERHETLSDLAISRKGVGRFSNNAEKLAAKHKVESEAIDGIIKKVVKQV